MLSRMLVIGCLLVAGCGGGSQECTGDQPISCECPDGSVGIRPCSASDNQCDCAPGKTIPGACVTYCSDAEAYCSGTHAQYPSNLSCLEVCGTFVHDMPAGPMSPTLECRAAQLVNAKNQPEACQAAGPLGGFVCGSDECWNFCRAFSGVCGFASTSFSDLQDCMGRCGVFPNTAKYSTSASGNSLACRMRYLATAAETPGKVSEYCDQLGASSPVCQ